MGPIPAAQTVSMVRSISRACRRAALTAPSTGTSRLFAKPATGALASTRTATGSGVAILPRQSRRIGAQAVGEPQAPHQQNRPPYAVPFPASAGGDRSLADAQR